MSCLDNDALLGFVEGGLSPDQMQRVEEHIDGCAGCRRLASELAQALVSGGGEDPVPDNDPTTRPLEQTEFASQEFEPLAPDTLVDHYRVLRLIGRGGMGEVYLAEDTQLQRRVALKLIRSDCLGSRKVTNRFIFEARATARFSHPNIVGIYGVGEFAGRPYVALEFIEGRPLNQVMCSLPARGAVRIALGIAEALLEAHRHNILHRDLKPGNVMIGADGRARVLDFGLAKMLPVGPAGRAAAEGQEPSAESMLQGVFPATVGFVGTPGYAAPEQWRGQAATSATDVWALGMILYELFVGFHPYRGSGDGRAPAVAPGEPISYCHPADGSLAELVALLALPCLAVEPARRPSLLEVVQQLRRWLRRNDTVSVRPIRRRRVAILAVVGGVAAALLFGGLVWQRARREPARSSDASARAVRRLAVSVPQPRASDQTAKDGAAGPARSRASTPKRKRPVARKKADKPARAKPEPIDLDAPFPPR